MKPDNRFSKQQIAEDTEREMTRRPQKYGAAMKDDDTGLLPTPGKKPASLGKGQGTIPAKPTNEVHGEQNDHEDGQGDHPHSLEEACAQIDELRARLDKLDGGGGEQKDPQEEQQQQQPEGLDDEEGFGGGY